MAEQEKSSTQLDSAQKTRRQLIKAAAMGGAALVVSPSYKLFQTASAKADDQAVTDKVRWGLLVDVSRCNDMGNAGGEGNCNDCVTACEMENGWGKGSTDEANSNAQQLAQWMRKLDVRNPLDDKTFSLPLMCQHCENPPCVEVCPTGASFKRDDGIVLVDRHICIGCRYCMMACPYSARSFVHEPLHDQRAHQPRGQGCVESCTLCVHRVDKGQDPACVEACPHDAMTFGDLNDPSSQISQVLAKVSNRELRQDLDLNAGVRYTGLEA